MNQATNAVANSNIMLLLCAIPIIIVAVQAVVFLMRAWKEAGRLGITADIRKKVIANSAVFSIIPSLPIIIIMAILMPVLGKFLPWLRLSVIGSAFYENMAADMAVKAFGLAGVSDTAMTPSIFISVAWVMTLGVMMYPLANIIFLKRYSKGIKQIQSRGGFAQLAIPAMFTGLMALYVGPYFADFRNVLALSAIVGSALMGFLLGWLGKKTGKGWVKEFSFPLSMLTGMIVAILIAPLLA